MDFPSKKVDIEYMMLGPDIYIYSLRETKGGKMAKLYFFFPAAGILNEKKQVHLSPERELSDSQSLCESPKFLSWNICENIDQ